MPEKEKGCNFSVKGDKKRTRKYRAQQKEAKQKGPLKILNNDLNLFLRRHEDNKPIRHKLRHRK